MRELTVELGERSYPIYIGEHLLTQAAALFAKHGISKKSPLLVITDEHIAPRYLPSLLEALEQGGFKAGHAIVPAGEGSKSLAMFEQLISQALQAGLDRNSAIVALGGGVVGDLAGYVAAAYMRGIRFIQIPTTILAHDSSVGGKVAVNHPLAKNIIGAFHQPEFVLYDLTTLQSLPPREVRSGLAEVIKHGLIQDAGFVSWLEEHADELLALEPEPLGYALYKGCSVKAEIVSADERENGARALLNLGHTIGHALEAVSQYGELQHGEAIAIGMVGAARIGVKLGAPEEVYTVTKRMLARFGLPVAIPAHYSTDAIIAAAMHDKKFKEGQIVYIVPTAIGQAEINRSLPAELVRETVEQLKEEADC